jgi:beta-lactamase class C
MRLRFNQKMWRAFGILAAVAAFGCALWLSVHDSPHSGSASLRLEIPASMSNDWQGKIDYRALDRQLNALSMRPEMAGLAVAVVEEGQVRFVRTYGFVDRSTGAPVTPKTLFRWASVSKTVTGMMAATLANERRLNLELPLAHWQTSLRLPDGAETSLTLGQLLSHQTGLTKNAFDEKLEDGENPALLRSALAMAPLQCPPGTCHTYQNVAFDTASEILAQAAQEPFPEAVGERFFRPLGMDSAAYGMAAFTGSKDWARPHDDSKVRPLREYYWRVPAAAGIESNIIDFARWMQAIMGERPDIMAPSILKIAQAPRVTTPKLYGGDLAKAIEKPHYGLGLRSFIYDGRQLIGHSGAVDGYRATMIFDPATRTGVVAMWNSNWGVPFRIPFAVMDSYNKRIGKSWLDLSDIPLPVIKPSSGSGFGPNAETQ